VRLKALTQAWASRYAVLILVAIAVGVSLGLAVGNTFNLIIAAFA
jgi:hypothetical protein